MLLPVTFPTILANNTLGIAVGMASNICSFNLEELCNATIALMKDPQADLREIIPAPDFVGGGTILYDAAEMQNVLENGRGSVRVRAKWSYDKENNCISRHQIFQNCFPALSFYCSGKQLHPYRISGRLCLCHVDTGGGRQPVGRVVTAVDDGLLACLLSS